VNIKYIGVIVKVKIVPITSQAGTEWRWRALSVNNLGARRGGGVGSVLFPSCLTPGKKTGYQLYRRLDGPHGCCGWAQKISLGFEPWIIQSIVVYYTHYTIVATQEIWTKRNFWAWDVLMCPHIWSEF
jgi:hypothetical protein